MYSNVQQTRYTNALTHRHANLSQVVGNMTPLLLAVASSKDRVAGEQYFSIKGFGVIFSLFALEACEQQNNI